MGRRLSPVPDTAPAPTAAEIARELWEEGLHVIPLGAPGETPPSSYTGRPESWPKTARVKWRQYQQRQPTEQELEQWSRMWPNANYGILTGEQIVVVDADSAEAAAWVEANITFTPRRTVTAHGKHFFFRPPTDVELKTKGSDAAPIDFRGTGGYVVAPGSVHSTGAMYRDERIDTWGDTSWPELPVLQGKDIAAIHAYNNQRTGVRKESVASSGASSITPETAVELQDALRAIPADNYDTWVEVGQALHDSGLFDLWDAWSQTSSKYPGAEAMRAKWSSFTAGGGLTYRSVFHEAKQHGWKNPLSGTAPVALQETKPTAGLFVPASEIIAGTDRPLPYLIKPYLLSDTLALIFGDPGSGKSAIGLDMALHIAAGRDWHGHRVQQGAVFYIAGEGYHGIGRRLMAWGIANGIDPGSLPVWFSQEPAQLYDKASAERFCAAIGEMAKASGQQPRLIILDTLARNFGSGDENSTKDMGEFIAHVDEHLRRPYQSCVLIVHHTGQTEKQRARGSSTLLAALDTEYRVDAGDGDLTLTSTKQKDGKVPTPRSFWLSIIDLPIIDPDDNEPETSICTIPKIDYQLPTHLAPATDQKPRQTKHKVDALNILKQLYQHHRTNLEKGGRDSASALVTTKEWREACKAQGMPRQRYYDVSSALMNDGFITLEGPNVILIGDDNG